MTEKEAYKLLKKYKVPGNIMQHCEKVAYFAKGIAIKYKEIGQDVNVELVNSSALLHDLFRVIDIKGEAYERLCAGVSPDSMIVWEKLKEEYKGLFHCQAAAKFFMERGEDEMAGIIRSHRFEAIIDKNDKPKTLMQKIVAYSDMRVLYSNVVTLEERLADGQMRYNPNSKNMEEVGKIHQAYRKLEKEIFDAIGSV